MFHVNSELCIFAGCIQVFSQDKSIYEAVENAFITIYVRKILVETAKNLLYLAIDSNIGDLATLEFIVGALVSKDGGAAFPSEKIAQDCSSSDISSLKINTGSGKTEKTKIAMFSLFCVHVRSLPLLLPAVEDGIFSDSWRIRQSSVELLGDLLFKVAGTSRKALLEGGSDDEGASTEEQGRAIIEVLGREKRNEVLLCIIHGS
ncbi:Protein ILITYHIA [Camellia lanceoleosa]|uniref:Protein ILITYHIA n=1 Tax=Camellia lanceoleosa TaxID=1840588 RepID=A0ACC0HKZ1_9ERIC|nr:Protein ILITYHIA [Camellia lanceoleosa]